MIWDEFSISKNLTAARNLPDGYSGTSELAGKGRGDTEPAVADRVSPRLLLNLGSGQRPFDAPWINVDSQAKWGEGDHLFVQADIRNMPMFADNSAEMIVCHHCFEHLKSSDATESLKEWYRILQPGGSLIISIPDIRALALRWITGRMDDVLYITNLMGADMGDPADIHRWHYTIEMLRRELEKCDWHTAEKFDNRQIPGADIAADWWILSIEAIK